MMRHALALLVVLLCVACDKMREQPRVNAYDKSSFFPDGQSARPAIPGTVPRGFLREDREFFTGFKAGEEGAALQQSVTLMSANPPHGNTPAARAVPEMGAYVQEIPMVVTRELLARGQERFNIYCSPCHGGSGYGDGMIVQRGFPTPPSYHIDRLRQAPPGYFFDVITNGYGLMYSYNDRVTPEDRWAIVAYIRALQYSQHASPEDATEIGLKALQEEEE
jgi:mono/diheme cytochrome c family protein